MKTGKKETSASLPLPISITLTTYAHLTCFFIEWDSETSLSLSENNLSILRHAPLQICGDYSQNNSSFSHYLTIWCSCCTGDFHVFPSDTWVCLIAFCKDYLLHHLRESKRQHNWKIPGKVVIFRLKINDRFFKVKKKEICSVYCWPSASLPAPGGSSCPAPFLSESGSNFLSLLTCWPRPQPPASLRLELILPEVWPPFFLGIQVWF